MTAWLRRFGARGVFWRQLLRFAVISVPLFLEPLVMAVWSGLFLFWRSGRRAVMMNLRVIKPGSRNITNFFRTYRIFWNFAWSISDNLRFFEDRTIPDWEFSGLENFERLRDHKGGAIILTAHMGSYDLGAHLFSETSARQIVMVRAPEVDPQTHSFEERAKGRQAGAVRVDFNTRAGALALDLLHAVRDGDLVAIQGDRVTPGIASASARLFGTTVNLPSGPFALALAARAPIFPLFIIRKGRRRYQLLAHPPITIERTRDRQGDLQRAVDAWATVLESVVATAWHQWFMFEPMTEERAA